MKQSRPIFCILVLLISSNNYCQNTKKVSIQDGKSIEEFYVLKENNKIKHGQYLKYIKKNYNNKIAVAFGHFSQGERTGEWYFCHANGALASSGNYSSGLKKGEWIEYFDPLLNNDNPLLASLEFELQPEIIIDKHNNVSIEKGDSQISAKGLYESNNKTGSWNYYNRDGELVHRYNHTMNKLLFSSLPDSVDHSFPYLGGKNRFYEKYILCQEKYSLNQFLSNSSATFKLNIIEGHQTVERISFIGDEKNTLQAEKIIAAIPNDWILAYTAESISLQWTFVREAKNYSIILDFKQY